MNAAHAGAGVALTLFCTSVSAAVNWWSGRNYVCECRPDGTNNELLSILQQQLSRCGPENLCPLCPSQTTVIEEVFAERPVLNTLSWASLCVACFVAGYCGGLLQGSVLLQLPWARSVREASIRDSRQTSESAEESEELENAFAGRPIETPRWSPSRGSSSRLLS